MNDDTAIWKAWWLAALYGAASQARMDITDKMRRGCRD